MAKPKKSKKFDYNLESVLKVRKIREKERQEEFAKADTKFKEEKKKEEEIKGFQTEKYQEMKDLMAGEIQNFQEVLMRKTHLDIVKEQVEEQEKVRETAEEEKEAEREKLVEAVKKKKIIEKDKDKKRDQWKKIMIKEENKFLDDIANVRFEHKRRAEDPDS